MSSSELLNILQLHDYQLIAPIGKGGSAVCYLVFSKKYKMNFVCKEIHINERLVCSDCELNALKNLNSNEIINLYDYFFGNQTIYLFLEFCSNGSLLNYVKKYGPLEPTKLLGITKVLLSALEYIHKQKFAHLDIKPANILIDRHGRPKLADFGISRFIDNTTNTASQRAGTAMFMAPEITSRNYYDPFAADIYSLGVTLYYLGSGYYPFKGENNDEIKKAIHNGLYSIHDFPKCSLLPLICSMLSFNPKERPTAEKLLQSNIFKTVDKTSMIILPPSIKSSKLKSNLSVNSAQNPSNISSKNVESPSAKYKFGLNVNYGKIITRYNDEMNALNEQKQIGSCPTQMQYQKLSKNMSSLDRTRVGKMVLQGQKKRRFSVFEVSFKS